MVSIDDQTLNDFLKQVEEYKDSPRRMRIDNELDDFFNSWVKNAEEFFRLSSYHEVFSQPHEMEKDSEIASVVAETFNFAFMAELVLHFGADKQDLIKFMKIINVAYSASYIRLISHLARNVEESKKRRAHKGNKSFGPSAGKSYENRDNN